ncbi:MAG: glycosyltransferase family 2 protein, partial [Clostridia bacterium]
MNDIKLSVIVPVYNTEEYLKKCLDSIVLAVINLKNKYQYNSEIIIINDGSKGDTKSIVNEYLNNFPRIVKYFEKTNSGLGATKNYGLNMAIGKYINFVDSDDYIDENTYCKVFDIIKKDNSDIVIYDFEAIPNNNKSFRTIAKNNNITDNKFGCIYTDIMPSSCNKVILKKIYDNESFPINLGYEDLGLTLLLLLKVSKISYIPEMLYKYNLRENSIMRKKFDEKKLDMCDVLNILFSKLDNIENNENSD